MRRRQLLIFGGLSLAAGLAGPRLAAAGQPLVIRLLSDRSGARVAFSPVGLFVEPGQIVRWVNEANVHTVTAYHPANGRPLRIPEAAQAWDSGYLIEPGQTFEQRFTVPGVYDYFCRPHERAGMVGRLVVGQVSGPGAGPFGDADGAGLAAGLEPIPQAARASFPDPHVILRKGLVVVDPVSD